MKLNFKKSPGEEEFKYKEGLKSELVTISSLTDLGELETEANDIF